jgi:hypothetical protein
VDVEAQNTILSIYRGAAEMQDGVIDRLRRKVQQEDENEDIRVKFLKREIDEKTLASISLRRYTARQKALAMLHVFELYSTVVIEQLNETVDTITLTDTTELDIDTTAVGETIDTISRARQFSNQQFKNIAFNFGTKAHFIKTSFRVGNKLLSFKEF